jgi:hypothetical protein
VDQPRGGLAHAGAGAGYQHPFSIVSEQVFQDRRLPVVIQFEISGPITASQCRLPCWETPKSARPCAGSTGDIHVARRSRQGKRHPDASSATQG